MLRKILKIYFTVFSLSIQIKIFLLIYLKYQKYNKDNNVIEIVKDNENDINGKNNDINNNKEENIFSMLCGEKDESMIIFNQLTY